MGVLEAVGRRDDKGSHLCQSTQRQNDERMRGVAGHCK